MKKKVVKFYPKNAAENPDAVLEQAVGTYDMVLILGWDKEGFLDARASTNAEPRDLLWLIEQFKANIVMNED